MAEQHAGQAPARTPRARTVEDLEDPTYRRGVVALLGTLAYGELVSFFTVVADADRAPSMADKVKLTRVALSEFAHFDLLTDRLTELGADPEQAMEASRDNLDEWHRRCTPSDWYEGLMKVYAGSTIAIDFYKECVPVVDPDTQELMRKVLDDSGHYLYAEHELRAAIEADPKLAARMGLWGRRIVGEALSQAQRAAAENDDLTGLLIDSGSGHGFDLAELMRLFTRITEAHTRRMEALGLSA
ncbi:hypothetical protein G9U51_11955 [Calidifontibacter sp. DB0510]|uniref:Ferritin-like domain-containing protein n=1 Tax=Metallococcus carri TaxID=1656884 RepID=A0A967E9K7_9MICO|nr:ferritin-like fold-containing protein [Metallococcus carri]NHN56492.1 hypothetical protein [Metallococcus carri]NOP36116.1 hypothetical protein [Calidifontibacter sp. DB2511S]